MECQGTKWRRNIVENFNRLSRVDERYRQTDSRGGFRNFHLGRPVKGQANFGYYNRRSGLRGDHGDDLHRLGRPGTSLGRPRPNSYTAASDRQTERR